MQPPPAAGRRAFLATGTAAGIVAAGAAAGVLAAGTALGQESAKPAPAARLPDLRAVIARARPSVLPVGTYSATASPRFTFRGSGFVVADGHLLVTNAHVLPAPGEGSETTQRLAVLAQTAALGRDAGDLRFATLAAVDRAHDLAVLRLDGTALPALPLAEDERVAEGQAIALMGFPAGGALGFAPVTHRGIVASVTTIALPAPTAAQLDPRALARLRAGNIEVLQLDATAYPGNSGGPVLDADTGRVVGVVNMVAVRGSRETALSAPTGITYAIALRSLRALLAEVRSVPR